MVRYCVDIMPFLVLIVATLSRNLSNVYFYFHLLPLPNLSGSEQYMVCSDIAARGLDIPEIGHVVLFDFPLNPIDYLHRAGRCGRAGRKGELDVGTDVPLLSEYANVLLFFNLSCVHLIWYLYC